MPSDSVILINRQKIQIGNNGKIFILDIPTNILKDLEVLDKKSLFTLFGSFIQKNAINLGVTLVFLSEEVCFTSDSYTPGFISDLPFEYPISIIANKKAIATNEDLYNSFVDAITSAGGIVKTVCPIFISPEMVGKNSLDQAVVKFLMSNENFYIKNSFVFNSNLPVKNETKKEGTKNKKDLILFAVFGILLLILVVVILLRFHH